MALYLGIDFGTSTNYIVSWDSNNKKNRFRNNGVWWK